MNLPSPDIDSIPESELRKSVFGKLIKDLEELGFFDLPRLKSNSTSKEGVLYAEELRAMLLELVGDPEKGLQVQAHTAYKPSELSIYSFDEEGRRSGVPIKLEGQRISTCLGRRTITHLPSDERMAIPQVRVISEVLMPGSEIKLDRHLEFIEEVVENIKERKSAEEASSRLPPLLEFPGKMIKRRARLDLQRAWYVLKKKSIGDLSEGEGEVETKNHGSILLTEFASGRLHARVNGPDGNKERQYKDSEAKVLSSLMKTLSDRG